MTPEPDIDAILTDPPPARAAVALTPVVPSDRCAGCAAGQVRPPLSAATRTFAQMCGWAGCEHRRGPPPAPK